MRSIVLVLIGMFLLGCGSKPSKQSPLDIIKSKLKNEYAYTITLTDMDFRNGSYAHKYKTFLFDSIGNYTIETSDWLDIDGDYFQLHEPNLGMEILSKLPNGDYNNLPTPPGFSQVINIDKYGYWKDTSIVLDSVTGIYDTIHSVIQVAPWVFKPEHNALAEELEIDGLKIVYSEYSEFKESFELNRAYYGRESVNDTTHRRTTRYGTYSGHWFYRRPGFYDRRRQDRSYYNKNMHSNPGTTRGGGGFGK